MEEIIEIIKNFGSSILGTISLGGIAAAVGMITKAKKVIEDTKTKLDKVEAKKDESQEALTNRYAELTTMINEQNNKIDSLTQEVSRVKGNRNNT